VNIPFGQNPNQHRLFIYSIFLHHSRKYIASKILHLNDIILDKCNREFPYQRIILELFGIQILGSFWSMDFASIVNVCLGVRRAVFPSNLNVHHVDQNTCCCSARGVVRPSTLLCRTLKARTFLLSTKNAFQLESCFGDFTNVCNNLPAGWMVPFEICFGGVNSA
jgi:hypothetical protein